MLTKLMLEHPRDIGETYGEHAGHALFIGTRMIGAGLACLVHALIPGLFVKTATNTVDDVISLMNQRSTPAPVLLDTAIGDQAA
jgi:hypothetical protein